MCQYIFYLCVPPLYLTERLREASIIPIKGGKPPVVPNSGKGRWQLAKELGYDPGPRLTTKEREATPHAFAEWLCKLVISIK